LIELIKSFLDFTKGFGFEEKPAGSLLSPLFEGEFNLSAGHQYVLPVITSDEVYSKPEKIAIVEPCFRRIDLGKIGYSPCHLLLFEMGVFGTLGYRDSARVSLSEMIGVFLNWFEEIGLRRNDLEFTVSKGAEILGTIFPADEETLEVLKEHGLGRANIIQTKGRRNFIYSKGENRPAGYSIEIFYSKSKSYIEIGSVNIYTHLYKKGRLSRTKNQALGGGVGFERVYYVVNGLDSVFEIPLYYSFIKTVKRYFAVGAEFELILPRVYLIAELIKSICFLIAEGQRCDRTRRGRVMKSLVNKLISEVDYLGMDRVDIVQSGVESFADYYKGSYPELNWDGIILNSTILLS